MATQAKHALAMMDSPRPIHDCHRPLPRRLVLNIASPPLARTSHITSERALLDLPNELLTTIYTHLPHPRDQIAFTLTCRGTTYAIANSPQSVVLKPGTLRYQGARWHYGKRHLLSDLRRWNLIPKYLQLCTSCWKYLPRNRIWRTRDGKYELKSLKKVDWNWAVMLWRDGGRICPTCQVPEGYEVVMGEGKGKALGDREQAGERKGKGEGVFVQAWGEGLVARTMVVQRYAMMEDV